jgi:predicted metal-binding membrane protein
MKETAVLMGFLRHDPIGQRFGVGILIVAWFALAWTSMMLAMAVPLLLVVAEVVRRRREDETIVVDDLDDLY